jgi:PAS domain-containing protein
MQPSISSEGVSHSAQIHPLAAGKEYMFKLVSRNKRGEWVTLAQVRALATSVAPTFTHLTRVDARVQHTMVVAQTKIPVLDILRSAVDISGTPTYNALTLDLSASCPSCDSSRRGFDGLVTLDRDGDVVWYLERYEEITSWSYTEVRGAILGH